MIQGELELIKNIDLLKDKNIVLFGASLMGKKLKRYLNIVGIDIFSYCDNDPNKRGKYFNETLVYSMQELESMENKEDVVIVVSSVDYMNEIINQLKNSMLWEVPIYTYLAVEYSVLFCTKYKELPEESRKLLLGTYKLWVDDQKKMVASFTANARLIELDSMNPVLVFHPAKVGSSSVYHSLINSGICAMHFNDLYCNINCTDNAEIKRYIFEHYKAHHEIKIISLVREPIARDLSYFFQAAITDPEWHVRGRITNDFVKDCGKILQDYTINKAQLQANGYSICDWFDYIALNGRHGTEFDWFDFEIKNLFGIDIYETPFNQKDGYSIIKKNNVKVLVIKMEMLTQLDRVIGEFVGVENFNLSNDNVGDGKNYGYMYKELKEKIRFPKEYFDFYYENNEYFNWFYSEKEREIFKRKWEMNIE